MKNHKLFERVQRDLEDFFDKAKDLSVNTFNEIRSDLEDIVERFEYRKDPKVKSTIQNLVENTSFDEDQASLFVLVFGREASYEFVNSIVEGDQHQVHNISGYNELSDLEADEGDVAILDLKGTEIRFQYKGESWIPQM